MSQSSYRKILKATSLFGGVQVFQIMITLVKSKIVAVLIGAAGMGISGLFMSSINMIVSISGFGLNYSAVRDISLANENNNFESVSRVIKIFRNWLIISGLFGAIGTVIFASYLSQIAFGNTDYVWAFRVLSIVIFIVIYTNGNNTLLQGMRHHKSMAKSSIIGTIIGLVSALPLYYFYGIKGIVPAIMLSSVAALFVSYFYTRKIKPIPVTLSFKETFTEGSEMLKLGLIMMISGFLGALTTFIINAFVSNTGGINEVGLYLAGMKLSNQYIGLVFTAMAVDYLPRLSAVCKDNDKVRDMVNQQAEIVILIITPILIFLMITVPVLIKIILTQEFLPIISFVRWIALGTLFKAAVYPVGYISFAKGDKWFFLFVDAITGNLTLLILNILFYKYWGLNGMGISFLIAFIISFFKITILTHFRYKFNFTRKFYLLFGKSVILGLIAFLITYFLPISISYITGFLVFIFSAWFSWRELDTRIGGRQIIEKIIRKVRPK